VLVAFIAFSLLSDKFFTPTNIGNILVRIGALGMLVLSQSYTFITGNFDLSVESTVGFTAMLAGLLLVAPADGGWGTQFPVFVVVGMILVVGGLIGLFNGTLITRIGVNNLIVTIAMLFILRGATYGISPGTSISLPAEFNIMGSGPLLRIPVTDIPFWSYIGRGNFVIPISGVFVIGVFVLAYVHTRYTQFGRNMYAIGADADAARASGIKVKRTLTIVYLIAGVCAATAGWIAAGRQGAAIPTLGYGQIFVVHAATIIGGISFTGGRGNVLGSFGGVLLWSILDTGLLILQVSPFWIEVSRGLLLLFAIFIDSLRVRYQRRVATQLALADTTIGLEDRKLSYES
jgi:ribose/xylose/arabinose/galactoside ABC-type transport system permease subunit